MSLFSTARRTRGLAVLALTAAVVTTVTGLTATPAAAASTTATGFTGYTDKAQLQTTGRAVVQNDALPISDATVPSGSGTTYYVDSQNGDDSQSGTTEATAWKSFAKVNATVFEPGDRILLKAGSEWAASGDQVAKEAFDYTTCRNGVATDVTEAAPTALVAPQGSGTASAPPRIRTGARTPTSASPTTTSPTATLSTDGTLST